MDSKGAGYVTNSDAAKEMAMMKRASLRTAREDQMTSKEYMDACEKDAFTNGKLPPGWMDTSDDWFSFVRDAFDMLYREGCSASKMMLVGLHLRSIGHPARVVGLELLLDSMLKFEHVWIARRIDIANH
jgi:hypothetical protein